MLREHQFLHGLAWPTLARVCFPTPISQSGSLIKPPEPLQRNAVWGIFSSYYYYYYYYYYCYYYYYDYYYDDYYYYYYYYYYFYYYYYY